MTRSSWKRTAWSCLALVGIVGLAVIGYRMFGRTWVDSLYMVVITIATIGYGEHSELSSAEQLFTIAVVLFGMTAATFTVGGLIRMMIEGELEQALRLSRNSREIDRMSQHVIVCGFGRMGQILCHELKEKKQPHVVVDNDPSAINEAQTAGYLALAGDATEDEVLLSAGVQRAKCLVTVLPNDAANVFITLTSRNLHREMQIIARGELPSTQKKLLQAGANRVVLPAQIGAARIAAMITHPSTLELMELATGRSVLDVEVDELHIPASSPVVGKTVVQIEARRKHRLLVVAIKQAAGAMVFNPDTDQPFAAGDVVIVMGRVEDIERFRREFQL